MKEHERELTLGRYWRHVKEESNNPYLLSDYLEIPIDDKNLVKYYSMLLRLAGVLYDAPASATFSEKLEAFIDRKPEYAGIDAYGALAGSLAGASCSEKQMKKALEYAEMCRSLHKGKGTMSEYESLGTLAGVYYWLGVVTHNDEYDRMFYKAHYDRLPLAERLFGKESGPVINTLSDLALFADNKEDRLSYGLRAVNMAIALFGPNNILVARPHHYLGCVYRDYRIWDEALEHFKIANTIWLKAYGLYHEILNSSFGNVGDSYTGMGLNNEALDCYNKCLSIQKRIFGEKRYEYAIVAYKLAIVFRKLGKGEEVIHWANEAKVTLTKGICKDEQRSKDLLKILMKDFAPYLI